MTQRVRNGLGLPAGFYRLSDGGFNPTFYAPNGITADGVPSMVYANVIPVDGGFDAVGYDSQSGVFIPSGSPNPSKSAFNGESLTFAEDVLRMIFGAVQSMEDFPYYLETSSSRANIVGDLATLKADFVLNTG